MNINFYNNYFLNSKEKYTSKYSLILIALVFLATMVLFIPYQNSKVLNGQVIKEDNKYFVLLLVSDEEIKDISDKCIIDKTKYNCHISKVERHNDSYLVLLDIKLASKYLIENYPIDITVKINKENIYQKIKKGWGICK